MFGIVLSSMCSKSQIIAYTYIMCNIAAMEKFKDKYTIVEKNTIISWDNKALKQTWYFELPCWKGWQSWGVEVE